MLTHRVQDVDIVVTDRLDDGDLGLTRGGLDHVRAGHRDAETLGDEVSQLGVRGTFAVSPSSRYRRLRLSYLGSSLAGAMAEVGGR